MKRLLIALGLLVASTGTVYAIKSPITGLGKMQLGSTKINDLDQFLRNKTISKKVISAKRNRGSSFLPCKKTVSYDVGNFKISGASLNNCQATFHNGVLAEFICNDTNQDLIKALELRYGGTRIFKQPKGDCPSSKDMISANYWTDIKNGTSLSSTLNINYGKNCKSSTSKKTQLKFDSMVSENHACYTTEEAEKTKSKINLDEL